MIVEIDIVFVDWVVKCWYVVYVFRDRRYFVFVESVKYVVGEYEVYYGVDVSGYVKVFFIVICEGDLKIVMFVYYGCYVIETEIIKFEFFDLVAKV